MPPSVHAVKTSETAATPGQKHYLTRGAGAYRRASLALFLSGFSTFSLLYCVQPLLPIFSQEFAVSPAESSLSLSLSTGFLAVAIVCAAAVSEGLGRRSLMSISLVGAALLTIATAFAPNWHLLLVIRALQGLVLGGVPAVAMAYLAEEIDPRGLGATMGLYVGGTAFGGMSGRVLTGIFAEYLTWRPALFIIGTIGLAAALGFIALLPPSRNFVRRPGFDPRFHAKAWLGHLRNPALPFIFAIAFLAMGSFVTIYNYAGFRLVAPPYGLNQTELGLIFTVYLFGIGAFLDRRPVGRPDRALFRASLRSGTHRRRQRADALCLAPGDYPRYHRAHDRLLYQPFDRQRPCRQAGTWHQRARLVALYARLLCRLQPHGFGGRLVLRG